MTQQDDLTTRDKLVSKIIKLSKSNPVDLVSCVNSITTEELKNVMSSLNDYLLDFSRSLLKGCDVNSEAGISRRQVCLTHLIQYVNSVTFNKVAIDFIYLILDELDGLPESNVVEICSYVIEELEDTMDRSNCEIVDILPKCMSIVYACDHVSVDGKRTVGTVYLSSCISKLIQLNWTPTSTIKIASVLKEIPLQDSEFDLLLKKLFFELAKIEYPELPPLIYQLLLLSTKGKKREIIIGILNHFNKLDLNLSYDITDQRNRAVDALRAVESVTLQMIDLAVKQDQSLAKEFLKLLKEDISYATHFAISVLFVVASIPALSTDVYRYVKTTVDAAFKDSLRIRYFYTHETDDYEEHCTNGAMASIILETVSRGGKGREFLSKTIIDLGLSLLDSKRITKHPGNLIFPLHELMNCHDLGHAILAKIFHIDIAVRGEIIDNVFNRIVTGVGIVEKYTELLYHLIRQHSNLLDTHLMKFKETIEYFSYFDPATAQAFFEAVGPLVRMSADFQNSVMLVLRKALYSRELDSRLIALNGFLQILKSSVSSSMGSSSRSRSVSEIDQEILGILRRCLSQQDVVRKRLYEGLYEVASLKEELQPEICKIFSSHLQQYFTAEEAQIDKCIKDEVIVEPFPHLFYYASMLGKLQTSPIYDAIAKVLPIVHDVSMSDYDIGEKTDFSADSDKGRNNQMVAGLLLGLHEAMIELFVCGDMIEDKETVIASSLSQLIRDKDLVRKAVTKKKTEKGAKQKAKATASTPKFNEKNYVPLLSLDVTLGLLEFIEKSPAEMNEDVRKYTIDLCKQQLAHLTSMTQKRRDYVVAYKKKLNTLGKRLLRFAALTLNEKRTEDNELSEIAKKKKKPTKGKVKSLAYHALECFEEAAILLNIYDRNAMNAYLVSSLSTTKKPKSTQTQQNLQLEVINEIINGLTTWITKLIDIDAHEESTKLIDICLSFTRILSQEQLEKLITWCKKICETGESESTNFVKSIIRLYIVMCGTTNSLRPLTVIAQDIKTVLGDFLGHCQIGSTTHKILGDHTMGLANEVTTVYLECISDFLQYLTWKLDKVKLLRKELAKNIDKGPLEVAETISDNIGVMQNTFSEVFDYLLDTCTYICQSALSLANYEKLNPLIVAIVRCLHVFSEYMISTKTTVLSEQFKSMTESAGKWIKEIFFMIKRLDGMEHDNKSQLERARKTIPDIFYQITEYNNTLAELGKKTNENLLANFQKVPARQFKFSGTIQDDSSDEDAEDDEKSTTTSKKKAPKRKRKKTEPKDEEEEESDDKESQRPSKRSRKS